MTSALANVTVVLVDTRTPANIGAVARCMMNMGLSRLVLVRPPRDVKNDAVRLSAGAHGILERASVCSSLKEAVADQGLVIGTSRIAGRLRKNVHTPRAMAARMLPLLDKNRASLVFGNEVNGLERDDLTLCQEFISIPSSEAFPSLNLSHAVMVVAYELFIASCGTTVSAAGELACAGDLENFYLHLQTTLQNSGFLDDDHPERMMFYLRQIFGKARLDAREVNILRGILRTFDRSGSL